MWNSNVVARWTWYGFSAQSVGVIESTIGMIMNGVHWNWAPYRCKNKMIPPSAEKIRIKIFVLWFHGRCHIEQIDVRLLNRTEDRNDVSTWNLVQMLHRHRYTKFSWNFKYLFQIWITVKSNMIGRFIVAMVTNSKHWRHDYVCYVTKYLVCPKFNIDGLFNF